MDDSGPSFSYGKLFLVLLLVALPLAGFWAGIEYARSVGSLVVSPTSNNQANNPSPSQATATAGTSWSPTSTSSSSSTDNSPQPDEIIARSLITIPTDQTFTLPNLPLVNFKINAITKAVGGLSIDRCGIGDDFIFIKHTHIFSTPGTCISTGTVLPSSTAALIVVDLTIDNQSNNFLASRYVQLFYNTTDDQGNSVTQLATPNPNWESYGGRPYASQRILLGFVVPDYQNDFQLVYGDYGRLGVTVTNDDFFGRSVSGFLVNFSKKTVSNIPG